MHVCCIRRAERLRLTHAEYGVACTCPYINVACVSCRDGDSKYKVI